MRTWSYIVLGDFGPGIRLRVQLRWDEIEGSY